MLGGKSTAEKNARQMVVDHVEKVGEVLAATRSAVSAYLEGRLAEAKEHGRQVDRLETEADHLMRSFVDCLQGGAFLPLLRKDLYQAVAAVDKVANAAESACDFCLSQRPAVPPFLVGGFLDITHANAEMYPHLRQLIELLRVGSFGMAGDEDLSFTAVARTISMEESNIDDLEWKLTRDIFRSDLELAAKIHLHSFVNHLTRISDLIEDVADRVQMMLTREAV